MCRLLLLTTNRHVCLTYCVLAYYSVTTYLLLTRYLLKLYLLQLYLLQLCLLQLFLLQLCLVQLYLLHYIYYSYIYYSHGTSGHRLLLQHWPLRCRLPRLNMRHQQPPDFQRRRWQSTLQEGDLLQTQRWGSRLWLTSEGQVGWTAAIQTIDTRLAEILNRGKQEANLWMSLRQGVGTGRIVIPTVNQIRRWSPHPKVVLNAEVGTWLGPSRQEELSGMTRETQEGGESVRSSGGQWQACSGWQLVALCHELHS